MGGSQIPQYLGKKARADLLLAVYAVKLFCFCYFRSTVEGRSHDDTDASGFGIYIYPALFDGFFGRSVGELHEHTGLFTQFGRHVILGIELLDFSGYLDGKIIVCLLYTSMDKYTIENLELFYGDFKALKNINMKIQEKEITAFIGPSGCGKSTLLKTLNRMNDLVEGCRITGSVKLDGEDIYGKIDVNNLRKRVGMVFQKPNPFPMSIFDNIAYGPRTHGVRAKSKLNEIVEKSLRDVAIWDEVKDRLNKSALGLSGCLLYTSK